MVVLGVEDEIFDSIVVGFVEVKVVWVVESIELFILSIVLTLLINGYLPYKILL